MWWSYRWKDKDDGETKTIPTNYIFNNIINIENFNRSNIEKEKNSYKDTIVYYITYLTIKEYVKICSVNPVYLYGYFYEINGDKYLMLVPTNKSKDKIKKIWKNAELS